MGLGSLQFNALLAATLALAACTNGTVVGTKKTTTDRTSSSNTKNPNLTQIAPFVAKFARPIVLVRNDPKNQNAPTPKLFVDIMITPKTGPDSLSQTCTSTNGCQCVFGLSTSSGMIYSNGSVDHIEDALIRCDASAVSNVINQITAMVEFPSIGSATNAVVVTTSTQNLNLNDPETYLPAIRYQCFRDTFLPFYTDRNLIDPIESNNPAHRVYQNYYTTNLGDTLKRISLKSPEFGSLAPSRYGNVAALWDQEIYHCPEIMGYRDRSDVNVRTPFDLFQTNKLLFSEKSPSKYLYDPRPAPQRSPATTDNSASHFQLARSPVDQFTEPVFAITQPKVINTPNGRGAGTVNPANTINEIAPLGFAVAPQDIKGDRSTLICPNDSRWPADRNVNLGKAIPSGFRWKKLWIAKATLPKRKIPRVNGSVSSVGNIYCNGATFTRTDKGLQVPYPTPSPTPQPSGPASTWSIFENRAVIEPCSESTNTEWTVNNPTFAKFTVDPLGNTGVIASRYFQGPRACYKVTGPANASSNPYSSFRRISNYGGQGQAQTLSDFLIGLFPKFSPPVVAPTPVDYKTAPEVQKITTSGLEELDPLSIDDYLFFTTDTDQEVSQITNGHENLPKRLKSMESCQFRKPAGDKFQTFVNNDAISENDCEWIHYEPIYSQVEENAVVTNPNIPGGVGLVPAQFPLCVIQPDPASALYNGVGLE